MFAGLEEVFQMLVDGDSDPSNKHADELLRQPDGFLRDADFDAVLARLPGEDRNSAVLLRIWSFFQASWLCDGVQVVEIYAPLDGTRAFLAN